jgi:hypothetical protein
MSIVLILALVKTMFFMRIFNNFSYLVTLIKQVIYDLRFFTMFYFVMVFMFSLIFGVLGFQNYTKLPADVVPPEEEPGKEYKEIGRFAGNIITVVRMSVGDNDFDGVPYLGHSKAIVFWIVWGLILYVTCICFMNFIIAEACHSYEKVSENIDNILMYQRANLINESEEMLLSRFKNTDCFPRFIIVREMEE